ncbi:O-antigen ligase family protein [Jannaschia formosa]|uniref:O-antigen ligase family protein n=1 Tax=Jannaschia formosa TaxID=2259592 RepID=UPI000E1C1ADF|nr:O-antigen ligase family protein [Jannaschia formosa]TFL17130.1 O-antigen ligase domain-containing protein [Jannaschia formosa]
MTQATAEQGMRAGRLLPAAGLSVPRGLLAVFLISLLIPVSFELAGIRLSPTRLLLLASIVPLVALLFGGRLGRVTAVDGLILFHVLWIFVALLIVHGGRYVQTAGITSVELLGGYLAGRALVRRPEAYRAMFVILLGALLVLLPVAAYESVTGKMVIPDLLRPVFDTPVRAGSAYGRMGLERVYGVFDHPILWGLFCALLLANFVLLFQRRRALLAVAVGASLYGTFVSLSSAPLLACLLQVGLLGWGWMTGGRWKLLFAGAVLAYVAVDLASNRTPVTILIETLTFNSFTGWVRLAIFDAGWAAVMSSPVWGIGFNDWPRPAWVTSSVDNFWLLTAMRYGLVGAGSLTLAVLLHGRAIIRAPLEDEALRTIRRAYLISGVALIFVLMTVHVWDSIFIFVMFLFGAGVWIYAEPQAAPPARPPARPSASASGPAPDVPAAAERSVHTRFARTHRRDGTGAAAPRRRPTVSSGRVR